MKIINHIKCVLGLLCLMTVAVSCQTEEKNLNGDSDKVPVTFLLQSSGLRGGQSGNVDGPQLENPRELYADRVQVNVYRRALDGNYANDADGFVFDHKMTLPCVPVGTGNSFPKATGVLDVKEGFEYRTTAFAYSEAKSEKGMFTLDHTADNAYVHAKVALTMAGESVTPELFFGTPRYGASDADPNGGTVLFAKQSNSKSSLYGILYRCVAGVEVTLKDLPGTVQKLTLLTGKINTESQATVYDDFLLPGGTQLSDPAKDNRFVLAQWVRQANEATATEARLVDASLLPVDASPLYMKIEQNNGSVSIVHIRLKRAGSGSQTGGTYPEGGSGTGIIPNPDAKPDDDPDVTNGDLNFKRNNYYIIQGSYNKLMASELPLSVTINPYWDGDHQLDVDKK